MEQHKISKGSSFYIGAPANPMPPEIIERISQCISKIDAVAFAYLPLMYLPAEMDTSKEILCLFLRNDYDGPIEPILESVDFRNFNLPEGYIDILPMKQNHQLTDAIISTGCCICVNNIDEHNNCLSNIECLEKKKPGKSSGLFSRIFKRKKKEIQE